jgi:copper homeostasis protein
MIIILLGSGQQHKVLDGLSTLESLFITRQSIIEDDAWGLAIMPGSGVNGATVPKLLRVLLPLGLREIHLSGGRWLPSEMLFKRNDTNLGVGNKEKEWSIWRTEEQEVRLVREIADVVWRDFLEENPGLRR